MEVLNNMKGLLTLHRIIISYKQLCKTSDLNLTYNEFIVIVCLSEGSSLIKELHYSTLIDKGQLVRILSSLIKKGFITNTEKSFGYKYTLTSAGKNLIINLYIQRSDHLKHFLEEELVDIEKIKEKLFNYEEKLQKITFNYSQQRED